MIVFMLLCLPLRGGDFYISGSGALDGEDVRLLETVLDGVEKEFLPRFKLPGNYRLKVYVCKDLEEFRRLTGAQWWNGGYFHVGRRTIYLQRLKVLREKGILEKTVAHEYLHFLTWRLAGRNCPVWLNEGLVLNLTGEIQTFNCGKKGEPVTTEEIEKLIISNNREQTRKGYCFAAMKVRDMLRKGGFEKIRLMLIQLKRPSL